MRTVIEILYVVSSTLLVPVILSIFLLLAWSLMEVGGVVREFVERRKGIRKWLSLYKRLLEGNRFRDEGVLVSEFFGNADLPGFLGKFSWKGKALGGEKVLLRKLASDIEIEMTSRLSRMSFGVRLGPMLGLMGTLIPLGPALIGLASGDIREMARNLVVAFSTTVLGLAVGGICYSISVARRRWYAMDMSDIEFVLDCLCSEGKEKEGKGS